MNRIALSYNKEMVFQYNAEGKNWWLQKDGNQDIYISDKEDNLVAFLVLLYEDPTDLFDRIRDAFPNQNQLNEAIIALPLAQLVKFCIGNKLFYWIEHAIKWLSIISIDNKLIDLIYSAINDKEYPQNIRHALRRWVNVIKKE